MNRPPSLSLSAFALATTFLLGPYALSDDSPLTLNLRSRAKSQGQGAISVAEKAVAWAPETTAIIVCDMWGSSSRRPRPSNGSLPPAHPASARTLSSASLIG